jgi:maleate isomerase
MSHYSYTSTTDDARPLGLIVLQADETIEQDMQRLLGTAAPFVTRVPSGATVTTETLQQMAHELTGAAALLPQTLEFSGIGYGCTSGTAQIGATQIAGLVKAGVSTQNVTEPVTALLAACHHLGIKRLAFLSPYIAEVSNQLRLVLREAGIETPVFGSFAEEVEEKVVRIDEASITAAALDLCANSDVDGLFLSCTNLRTLDVIEPLEQSLGLPVLSSNLVLAWHLSQLAHVNFLGEGALANGELDQGRI